MNAERPEERVDETPEEQQAESQDDAAAETGKDEQETPVKAAPDVENAHKFALERFGKELLAVRDTLEMGLAAAENATVETLTEGKEATLKLLTTVLQQFGIEEVDPAGEPFDPELHEAISMQPSDDVEPGSVVSVIQKGYTLNGRLLRPAMVIVAAES